MMEYGLQMYSLRDITGEDLKGALKKVSEIGYKGVEFAGFFGHSAEEVKSWLDEYGLKVTGTHTGYNLLADDFDGTVAYHKAIGCDTLIVPGADTSCAKAMDELVENFNKWQPMLEKEGISLQYHNHHSEFLPNKDGQIPMEEMAKRTNIKFEIDTYWAFAAKRDPLEVITRLKDRISFIHLKDGNGGHTGYSLGMGSAPVKAVWERAKELGFYMVVESEGCDPDGVSEVTRCFEYLKSLGE
ncbi:MAG TPA: sugar phosphate isomerase/epimerase [Candidatus Merdivicinus intestinigallinarum]|nr:sugar phosphate isomerase/epimerase [Candidatus Merdivicinus intestinigallinarum]